MELLRKVGEFSSDTIKYIIEDGGFSPTIYVLKKNHRSPANTNNECIRNYNNLSKFAVNLDVLCECCRLCREFADGIPLSHDDRFLIMTNIRFIKGAKHWFFDIAGKYYPDSYDKWKYDYRYIKSQEYRPMGCEKCPYCNGCDHDSNLLQKVKSLSYRIEKINPVPEYIGLDEAYDNLCETIDMTVEATEKDIYVIKAQTSLGKSKAIRDYIKRNPGRYIIAEPLVKLKWEFKKRLGDKAAVLISDEDLSMSEDARSRIKYLYSQGQHKETLGILKEEYKDIPDECISQKQIYWDYFHKQELMDNNDVVVMTHNQLMNLPPDMIDGFTVFIDEDIVYTMFKDAKEISVNDIRTAVTAGIFSDDKSGELKAMLEGEENFCFRCSCKDEHSYLSYSQKERLGIKGNINEFFSADVMCRCQDKVRYLKMPQLPHNVKVIVLSATTDKQIYEAYGNINGRNIRYFDIPKVKYKGNLIQYCCYSMSRECIENKLKSLGMDDFIKSLEAAAPDVDYSIGFKKYERAFRHELHFGNAVGIDGFKGKNALILGTPFCNEIIYRMVSCYLGADANNVRMNREKVEYGNYMFPLKTFADPLMRQVQLYMLSSELEQCVGRSRLLRTEATVYVFSYFPCEQAQLHQEEYLGKCQEQVEIPA